MTLLYFAWVRQIIGKSEEAMALPPGISDLRGLIARHAELTGSAWAQRLLGDFRGLLQRFWLVKPKAASLDALAEELRRAA